MPKDFAGRGQARTPQPRKRKPTKRASAKQSVLFHGPSFATGAVVGAAIVILAAYGPELFSPQDTATKVAQENQPLNAKKPTEIEFIFDEMLKQSEVQPDPEPYAVPEQNDQDHIYTIQVASFKRLQDAEQLRARLLLENLPVQTTSVEAKGERWYRVLVGPFQRKIEANRAINRLREQGLAPILLG